MAPTVEEMGSPFNFGGSTRIIVTVGEKRCTGSVSPHVMAQASPVWNKFLFPPFRKLETSNNRDSNGGQPANDGDT